MVNDAQKVFSNRFISTLKNVAKDVKYQVKFNSWKKMQQSKLFIIIDYYLNW
jgi:hypothetical protein